MKLCLVAILSLVAIACQHDPVMPDTDVSFNDQVLPIIVSNCASSGCHTGVSGGEEELIPLTNYSQIMKIVKPGSARDSELYKVITQLSGENAMPPGRPLSEEQIQLILVWINKGANNN